MRLSHRAGTAASVLALTIAAPAMASPTAVHRSTFEGRVATANWDACGLDGCFRTTATVSVGTVTANGVTQPSRTVNVSRSPYPAPAGTSTVIFAGIDDPVAHVAADLSSADGGGDALIYSQTCSDQGVCHGASFEPLGPANVAASWDAIGEARRFHERESHHVSRLTFEECEYTTTTSGSRRPADASLIISNLEGSDAWTWSLGTLTSATIGQVDARFMSRCTSPF